MTSRERVLTALNHGTPDRTPRLLYGELIGYVPEVEKMLCRHLGAVSPREYFDMDITAVTPCMTRLKAERFAEFLPAEISNTGDSSRGFSRTYTMLTELPVDEWGVWWQPGGFHHFVRIESPLRNVEDICRIKQYPWPDLDEPYRTSSVANRVKILHEKGLAVAAYAGSIFEQAWYIRGYDRTLEDMILRPEIADYLFDRTAYYQASLAAAYAEAGVDIVMLGDDVAHQKGLIMSPALWVRFLKARLSRTIKTIKNTRAETKVFYHSDGMITDLIPELIEAGVEVLNPVQPDCLEPEALKNKFGEALTFFGGVSVQKTMPFGTPEDVSNEVRLRVRTLGAGGGFILCPAHVLEPEVPWENIVAFFKAADERQ